MKVEPEEKVDRELEEVQSVWIDFESVFEDYDCSPPLKIGKDVVGQCYQKPSSKADLAVQLIKQSYSRKEKTTSNCAGDHRYKKKNPCQTAVKDALFPVYLVRPGQKEDHWRIYRIAIDSSCRQLNHSEKQYPGCFRNTCPSTLLLSTSCSDSVHRISTCIYQICELAR